VETLSVRFNPHCYHHKQPGRLAQYGAETRTCITTMPKRTSCTQTYTLTLLEAGKGKNDW